MNFAELEQEFVAAQNAEMLAKSKDATKRKYVKSCVEQRDALENKLRENAAKIADTMRLMREQYPFDEGKLIVPQIESRIDAVGDDEVVVFSVATIKKAEIAKLAEMLGDNAIIVRNDLLNLVMGMHPQTEINLLNNIGNFANAIGNLKVQYMSVESFFKDTLTAVIAERSA